MKYDVAIIGGGISGLSSAFFLKLARPELKIVLLESAPRFGGLISSYSSSIGPIEEGPYLFTRRKNASRKILSVLQGELQWEKADSSQNTYHILNQGGLQPLPSGIGELFKSPLLSRAQKLRLLSEPFKRAGERDESLAQFGRRRFGKTFSELFLEVPASSVFACAGEELSAALIAGQYKDWEQTWGSVAKGLWRQSWKQPPAAFPAPPLKDAIRFIKGMSSLVFALENWLIKKGVTLVSSAGVARLKKQGDSWLLELCERENITALRLIMCVPAGALLNMLPDPSQNLVNILTSLNTSPMAGYFLSFLKSHKALPRGFGFFQSPGSSLYSGSGVFLSNIFPNQFEPDRHCISVQLPLKNVPRSFHVERPQLPPEFLKVLQSHIIPANFRLEHSVYLPRGMPVYAPFHVENCRRIEILMKQLYPNIWINHSFFSGSGLERCMEQSQTTAEELGVLAY